MEGVPTSFVGASLSILLGLVLGGGCVGGVPSHDPVPGAPVVSPVVVAPATVGGGLDAATSDAATREISVGSGVSTATVPNDDARMWDAETKGAD